MNLLFKDAFQSLTIDMVFYKPVNICT